jgi:putative MATE family efflux protein
LQDLTTGSLTRHLLKTTSFMLVTMLFQTLYVLIDLYWVGRLGTEAVAAVAVSGNLMFVVLAATQMLGVGTTALIAHATGRKDRERAQIVFNQAQVLSLVVGLVFFVLAMAFRRQYASSMSADAVTAQLAADYLTWFIPGMTLQFGMVAMGAAMRGTGNFKPSMVVGTATVILNMALAPFLIFGWGTGRAFGVVGAAIATFIAIVVGTVWIVLYFLPKGSYLKFVRAEWRPRFGLWKDMLKIGLPAGAEFALLALYLTIVYIVCRRFGPAAQAGFGIGGRVMQAGFMPVVALGFAVAPVAGQNFGARRADRVRGTFVAAASISAASMAVLALVLQFAAAPIVHAFSSDAQAIAVGEEYLRIVAWSFAFSGVIFVSSSMFQALGNTVPPLVTSVTRVLLVGVPLLFMVRMPGFELRWVWYLSVATIVLQLAMHMLLLRREFGRRLNFEQAAV